MKAAQTSMGLVIGVAIWACTPPLWAQDTKGEGEKAALRIGTFDSRAVAAAYVGSEQFNRHFRNLKNEYEKAEAAGDTQKAQQLKEKGKAGQQRLHEQGFSTASVANILDEIKDQLPDIARKAGVDLIVSKWDIAYHVPDAEFVDVTRLLIEPFHPSERALRTVEELGKHAPIPLEEARKINVKD